MGTSNLQPDEYCSECCNFVAVLNPSTGWCDECTRKNGYEYLITLSCPNCGRENSDGKICSRCKYELWLGRNADSIELVMAVKVISYRAAERVVLIKNRPICQSCGKPIKGGQKGRHFFCTKNPECVKGHNTYEYHLRTKPQSEALTLAITAARIFKLTMDIEALNHGS